MKKIKNKINTTFGKFYDTYNHKMSLDVIRSIGNTITIGEVNENENNKW